MIINIPPIVGVPAFMLCIFANSVAFPTSHSVRIFFPSSSFSKSFIHHGIITKVREKESTRAVRIKIRFDIRKDKIPQSIRDFMFLPNVLEFYGKIYCTRKLRISLSKSGFSSGSFTLSL
jgi:hypothetical protein